MKKANSENIEKYRQLCNNGASLKLLSVYCTLRHPHKRVAASPYLSRRIVDKSLLSPSSNNEKETFQEKYPPLPLKNTTCQKLKSSNKTIFSSKPNISKLSQTNAVLTDLHSLPEPDYISFEQDATLTKNDVEKNLDYEKNKNDEASLLHLERAPKASRRKISTNDSISSYTNNRVFSSTQKDLIDNHIKNYISKPSDRFEISSNSNSQTNLNLLNRSIGSTTHKPDVPSLSNDNQKDLSLPCFTSQHSQILSLFSKNQFLDKVCDNSLHSLGTPTKNPRLAATCVSFLNRSPFRGKNLPLAQSPTVQLGNKVFHVPASIFLGERASPQKITKKTKPRHPRQPKQVVKIIPESALDFSISDTSDPYAFVPQKYKPKLSSNPVVSTQTLEDILLQAKNPELVNILEDSGDESCTDSSSNTNLTPKPFSKAEYGFLNASPFRGFPSLSESSAPDKNKNHSLDVKFNEPGSNQAIQEVENLGDLSVKMADLSFSNLPQPLTTKITYNSDLNSKNQSSSTSILDQGFQSSNSEAPEIHGQNSDSSVRNIFDRGFFSPMKSFSSRSNFFAESTPEEPEFDVQAFLDKDLGMFAGIKKL